MIKAVIFDIDGVLLDSFEANLKFFQNVMIHFGYHPPTREEFPPIFHLTMRDAIKKLTGLSSEEEIKKIWEAGKSREIDYPLALLKIPENAAATIEALTHQYLLGIVTSRVKESVYKAPKLAELQKYFQVVVSYEDTVRHKPDPEPLLLAAQKLEVKPEETVYIGDVENDAKAAHAAGMKVILYSKDKPGDADAYATSFEKLPNIIAAL